MSAVQVMHDVAYLLDAHGAGPAPLTRALIYRYRSGVLLRPMTALLRQVAAQQGRQLASGAFPLWPDFAAGGLLNVLPLYRWSKDAIEPLGPDGVAASLAALVEETCAASIHFIPPDSPVVDHPAWRNIETASLVIDEPELTPVSLPPALAYLAATSDLECPADLLEQTGFVDSFLDLVDRGRGRRGRNEGLAPLIQAFEERVLICTDRTSKRFDVALHRTTARRNAHRSELQLRLRAFVSDRDHRALMEFVQAFETRHSLQGRSARACLDDLWRITTILVGPRLARAQRARRSVSRPSATVGDEAVLWAALVLAWQPRFRELLRKEDSGYRRGPETFTRAVAALAHDYLARYADLTSPDPLAGRWSDIGFALAPLAGRADDEGHAADLAHALLAAVNARPDDARWWIRHLHVGLMAATTSASCPACAITGADKSAACVGVPQPRSFHDFVGQASVIGLLRRHVDRDEGINLLLYGPRGVGKRTLARVYAQALLCTAPDRRHAPCHACPACEGFAGGGFGYFELDGASPPKSLEVRTDYVVQNLPYASFSRRRIVLINNADHYPPAEFDRYLQPMELEHGACFILLARQADDVRLAGRSRSYDYRLRTLTLAQSLRLLGQICSARGLVCDEAALGVLARIGEGLPGRLHALCRGIIDLPDRRAETIKRAFGMDWVPGLVASFPALVKEAPAVVSSLMRAAPGGRGEQAQRLQEALVAASRLGRHRVLDASMTSLFDDEALSALSAALTSNAERNRTTVDAVWRRMAATWLSGQWAHDWDFGRWGRCGRPEA